MFIPARNLRPRRHLHLVQPRSTVLPLTRGECEGGARPCPIVSCRHNLCVDVTPAGGISVHWFPEDERDRPSCALDVAEDSPGLSVIDVAALMGTTRQRIDQIESIAKRKIRRRMRKADE